MSTYHLQNFMLAVAIECRPFDCLAFFSAPVANGLLSLMCNAQLTTLMRIGKADDQGPKLRGTARSIDICTHLQISNTPLRVASNDVSLLVTCCIKADSLGPKATPQSGPCSGWKKHIARSRTGTKFARRTGVDLFHLRISHNSQQHGVTAYLNRNLH